MNQGTCETCRWWIPPLKERGHESGTCRFNPPIANTEDWYSRWPYCGASEFCSNHKPKTIPDGILETAEKMAETLKACIPAVEAWWSDYGSPEWIASMQRLMNTGGLRNERPD